MIQLTRREVLLTGAIFLLSTPAVRAHNGVHHITIEKLAFLPANIEVKAGDTIEWTNKDAFAHTATVKGGWEVMIPLGKTETRVVEAGDSVEYYCRFHPNMKGTIKVIA